MAEQAGETTMQRRMNDFATGRSWVPAAPGPTGHARPSGLRWSDSPVVEMDAGCGRPARPGARAPARPCGPRVATPRRRRARSCATAWRRRWRRYASALVAGGYEVALEVVDGDRARLEVVNCNASRVAYEVAARTYAEPVASLADVHRNAGRMRPVIEISSRGRQRTRAPRACSRRAIARDCRHEVCRCCSGRPPPRHRAGARTPARAPRSPGCLR
ncbi:MAG: hypothetical protein U5K43_05365 [Halofilum sp. (in: g-proteobacteria)]|nr:hypothetical protein [Halofilum sp. (in: g-proteobacteria)]